MSRPVHVEVCLKSSSTAKVAIVRERVRQLLLSAPLGSVDIAQDELLGQHVQSVRISDDTDETTTLDHREVVVDVYQLNEDEMAQETEGSDETAAYQHWLIPHRDFDGLWESLVYDGTVKSDLLDYVTSAMLFSDRGVDSKLISWNRVVLLHGPPGTGKTSLCKALAQKLSVRLGSRYTYGQLVEINSHSLFSKWFSESGKLVARMFQRIHELLDDSESFVCLLIDEVESLTAARKAALSGTEPTDSIRVVNALLTQIDLLKQRPNVLILTTSNITGAIDLAFVDRADIKQYIGPPSVAAIYQILLTAVRELLRVGIVEAQPGDLLLSHTDVPRHAAAGSLPPATDALLRVAQSCQGLSGRALRKLPFIAHSFYVRVPRVGLAAFIQALARAAEREALSRSQL